jgi:hypothetical protein
LRYGYAAQVAESPKSMPNAERHRGTLWLAGNLSLGCEWLEGR